MKTKNPYLKLCSKLLVLILLLQSCNVYRSKSVSIDQAVEFNKKVKLTTTNNEVLKFKSLERDGEELIGIAKENSKAAKLMAENIVEKDYKGNFVKIKIPEAAVTEINQKNYTMSVIVPIAIGVAILVGLIAFIADNLVVMP